MGKQPKKPITMSFKRSFKRGDNGKAEIKAIAKEFGLTVEQVESDLHRYQAFQEQQQNATKAKSQTFGNSK